MSSPREKLYEMETETEGEAEEKCELRKKAKREVAVRVGERK